VRFVTIGADLMSLGRALLLGAMAAGAGGCLRSGMRFVTALATRVTGFDQAGLALVAAIASDFVGLRTVRQPAVATGAGLVPLVRGDLLDARLVTAGTGRHVAERELEFVRLVTTSASGSSMRAMIGRSELVT
jgi:hypothetical protein